MVILTLNCGSSSVKYQVYDWANKNVLGKGVIERVGQDLSDLEHQATGKEEHKGKRPCPSHNEAIAWVLEMLIDSEYGCIKSIDEVKAVGHRVVHGGDVFTKSVIINEDTLKQFEKVSPLAPLHNPANIMGIKSAMLVLPTVPHCAILDTAWHQTMDETAFTYALPNEWYSKHNVRRYGFHGTSFLYTAKRAAVLLGKANKDTNVIICHIGNGASICAVKGGVSVDTSMGMTPLEGLVMGSRSGDFDPSILNYIGNKEGLTLAELDNAINKKSGLLGITGKFTDRRDVEHGVEKGDKACILAQDMECYRLRKYIGSYLAVLEGKVDAIVFTAGVGEFGSAIRLKTLAPLKAMGIIIDEAKNALAMTRNAESCISADNSPIKVYVIPTDEELVMTEDTFALANGSYKEHTNYKYIFEDKAYVNKAREEALPKDLAKKPGLDKIIVKS
ncbi:MAG: acetate kinase [Spirochaetaceae bacterium]|nr:acetate kinase [Spirochaetaceae bacterium]